MRSKDFSQLSPAERARLKAARKNSVAVEAPVEPSASRSNAEEAQAAEAPGVAPASHSPNVVRDGFIPVMMRLAAGPSQIDGLTFRAYRDALVSEAEAQDVLEQMLLEQIALAHISTFYLQANTGMSKSPEAAGIYATAAAKLMAEVRRTIVALKELRTPRSPPTINVTASQQVNLNAKHDATAPGDAAEKTGARSEVGSKHDTAPRRDRLRDMFGEDSGRASEPAVARAAD